MRVFGFTLIELLVVIVLISILSLVAYPSYERHIIRTRRMRVAVLLLDRAWRAEKYYAINNNYDGADSGVSLDSDYYQIDLAANGERYILKAIPIGSQTKDTRCWSLTIDQDGNRGSNGVIGDISCWL